MYGMVLNGLDAFQPSLQDVVRDLAVPRLLPTAEQLSNRLCVPRRFHPRKVSCSPYLENDKCHALNHVRFHSCSQSALLAGSWATAFRVLMTRLSGFVACICSPPWS